MNVQPDMEFIRSLKEAGGDTLKKCFQCATCSVMCPLSKEGKPFPRKEMIWAQWGMRDKLITDPDVFLCHQCGDCTTHCPRGAKPGDVLSSIRAYAYTFYGWPKPLAKLASSAKGLPILIGLPVVVIFIMWLLSGAMRFPTSEEFSQYGYQRFFGTWDFYWYAKNIFFIVLIMVPSLGLALFSSFKGISTMWKTMSEDAGLNKEYRPSVGQFLKDFLWPSLVEIVKHSRFRECTTNIDRVQGHLPLMLAFIGLAIVTTWSLVKNDVLGLIWPSLHGPMVIYDPFKILANISAIALLFGVGVLWASRKKAEAELKTQATFYDWFLIWEIAAVGVTGLAAQLLRWAEMPVVGYIVYFLHLVSVMMLFLYLPYTKFAHLMYRTSAYAFEKYRQSVYAKNS
jgi:quinone-modifying oxidoreductase, subunit QmoC